MTKIILTRGLPASGKSTYARKLVEQDPTYVRLNRDDFRQMLFGKAVLDSSGESMVTAAQHGAVDNALKCGYNVIVDDTNFFARGVKNLQLIAFKYGAEVEFKDFTDVPLDELLSRDAARRLAGKSNLSGEVGEKVIRGMHDRYIRGRKLPLPEPEFPTYEVVPYEPNALLPDAVIVDIDGTMAKMKDRSPYDWMRVGEDEPVQAVIDAVKAAHCSGSQIIVMSGRDGSCKYPTLGWLKRHLGPDISFKLFMRAEKDGRRDDIVKLELFDTHVRNKFNIQYVLDDRDQVVRMWRKLGLTCMQVAPGDF
jgi:predicted kinase